MIAVVDSGVANLTSVMAALHRLGAEAEVTADAAIIKKADRVILPGVGAAGAAMAQLKNKNLTEILRTLTQPVFGICLGMQLLFTRSHEGKAPIECLGILSGDIKALQATSAFPVPHMGWNQIQPVKTDHPLLKNIAPGAYAYFVHGFAVQPSDTTIATTDYNGSFAAMAHGRNFYGCQFHPERSGSVGSQIIENFLIL